MMNINIDDIPNFKSLIQNNNINLRINLYKPMYHNRFAIPYNDFWEGIKKILQCFKIISNGEPILNAVLGLEKNSELCGCGVSSLRINPDGSILPCVYWKEKLFKINQLNENNLFSLQSIKKAPLICKNCIHIKTCKGGCEGRRQFYGLDNPDEYCPYVRNDQIKISYQLSEKKDLIHSSYLCTLILGI